RDSLRVLALTPFAALLALLVVLVVMALPAIRVNGIGFFVQNAWQPGSFYATPVTTNGVAHPPGVSYGALPLIIGTIASSAIAIVLAVPVAIGTALIIVEKLPASLSSVAGFFLEVLAGIPSVVYGLWGALTFGPWLARNVSPAIASVVPDVPVLRFFRGPAG